MTAVRIERLCVVGVGLIGGSLARDLRRLGVVGEVVGTSRREAHLERAVELGVVDRYDTDVAAAVSGADMVVVSTPLGAIGSVLAAMADSVAPGAVVTDVGSAKVGVIEAARAAFGDVPEWFVPAHPIAGTEHSGVEASLDGLFDGRRTILTPTRTTDAAALRRVASMWRIVGAEVVEMGPERHDRVFAATSHLPHMLAFTLVDALGGLDDRAEMFKYAAGGFRDFTRIASSDAQMWHDVCVENRDALLEAIALFARELGSVTEAIRDGDGDALLERFSRAKALRDRMVADVVEGTDGG